MKEAVKAPPKSAVTEKKPFFSNSGLLTVSPAREHFFRPPSIQTKLKTGKPGDKYEQEAEQMAQVAVDNNKHSSVSVPGQGSPERKDDTLARQPENELALMEENELALDTENSPAAIHDIGESIVAIARSKIGKVRARQPEGSGGGKPFRYGHKDLKEIFDLAAPGVWSDDVILYVGDGLPSWCGIFATYCIKKAGIDIGNWQMGKGVSAYGRLKVTSSPVKGDIGYMDANQHHCIVDRIDGDTVHSIDGNMSGEIMEVARPMKSFRGFFTALHNPVNLQSKSSGEGNEIISTNFENRLNNEKGKGATLNGSVKEDMENTFGADFSQVRIHTGETSAGMNRDIQAKAFTHGNDIHFSKGRYDPGSTEGKSLLAHELTHTIQQGASVRKKEENSVNDPEEAGNQIQLQPEQSSTKDAVKDLTDTVNVKSGLFMPPASQKSEIDNRKGAGKEVKIHAGGLAGMGSIKVRKDKGDTYSSISNGIMPLNIPLLNPASPVLSVRIKNNIVTGYATLSKAGSNKDLPLWIRKNAKTLGWAGIDLENIMNKFSNNFSDGVFNLGLKDVGVKVGGFVTGKLSFGIENLKEPYISINADIKVPGIADSSLEINNAKGKLEGNGEIQVDFKSFSGVVTAKYNPDGTIDIKGVVSYSGDRLSGSLTLMVTDKKTADNFARDIVGKGKPEEASLPAEITSPGISAVPRGMAGMGELNFSLTEWFTGKVQVIVDGSGRVTVIGKIAPPKEIILFQQKDYIKELLKAEARASYGIPVVGNVFVFANVSLSAVSKLGPAKIYDIEVTGTYSTDPDIAKSISLAGSLNISAYAGLRLRGEGGAGLQIVKHDLKVGAGVNADAGVKGYVDARPVIGYRDPGEFFFKGHMEIAAQPFLGLGGDLFVEVDSPWWSPLPDKKWIWPIGSLEYPLPGEFGIGADMEYVLGSGKVPEIKFSDASFDSSKFMSDLIEDKVPKKSGAGKDEKKGKFTDKGEQAKKKEEPVVEQPKPVKELPVKDKGKKKSAGDDKTEKDNLGKLGEGMQEIESSLKGKKSGHDKVTGVTNQVKKKHGFKKITITAGDSDWIITAVVGNPHTATIKVGRDTTESVPEAKDQDAETTKKEEKNILSKTSKLKSGLINRPLEKDFSIQKVKGLSNDVKEKLLLIDRKSNWKFLIEEIVDDKDTVAKMANESKQKKLTSLQEKLQELIHQLARLVNELVKQRHTSVTKPLKSWGAKLSKTASDKPESDLDFSFSFNEKSGVGVLTRISRAEHYLTEKQGPKYESKWRISLFADSKRLTSPEDYLKEMQPEEIEKLSIRVEHLANTLILARRYHIARDAANQNEHTVAAANEILKTATNSGIKESTLKSLADILKDNNKRTSARNKYLRIADKLEKDKSNLSKGDKSPEAKKQIIKLTSQVQSVQMLANLFTTDAFISPATSKQNMDKKDPALHSLANVMADWLAMFEHAYREDPAKALVHYEPWKYISRILENLMKYELTDLEKEYYGEIMNQAKKIHKEERNFYRKGDKTVEDHRFSELFISDMNGLIAKIRKAGMESPIKK